MKDNMFSDHRPVLGIFKILAHEHCEDKKQTLKEALKKQQIDQSQPSEPVFHFTDDVWKSMFEE